MEARVGVGGRGARGSDEGGLCETWRSLTPRLDNAESLNHIILPPIRSSCHMAAQNSRTQHRTAQQNTLRSVRGPRRLSLSLFLSVVCCGCCYLSTPDISSSQFAVLLLMREPPLHQEIMLCYALLRNYLFTDLYSVNK